MCAFAAAPTTDIKVDQVGYLPHSTKLAMVVSHTLAKEFFVRRAGNDSVAFHGKLTEPVSDPDSGDLIQEMDFTKLEKPGQYYLEVPGVGRSWNFGIGADVFSRAFYLSMRSYYGQRCGIAVDLGPEFPGYKHAACHLEGAYHASSGKTGPHISAKGLARCRRLWPLRRQLRHHHRHAAVDLGDLRRSRLKGVQLNIPESGNGHARHPQRDQMESRLDALHAG